MMELVRFAWRFIEILCFFRLPTNPSNRKRFRLRTYRRFSCATEKITNIELHLLYFSLFYPLMIVPEGRFFRAIYFLVDLLDKSFRNILLPDFSCPTTSILIHFTHHVRWSTLDVYAVVQSRLRMCKLKYTIWFMFYFNFIVSLSAIILQTYQ